MKVTTLVENTSNTPELKAQHGLSLYIETQNHKLLFDLGQDHLFVENAQHLGIDLSEVDIVIISHGHYDHGGGLRSFLEINSKAKIILSRHAFDDHFSLQKDGTYKNIGLSEHLLPNKRFVFIDEDTTLDTTLKIYTHIQPKRLNPQANKLIYMRKNKEMVHDDFSHEISLVISEGHKKTLIAGCAHCGIVNILDQVIQKEGKNIDTVIGGFHLYSNAQKTSEDPKLVQEIAKALIKTPTKFYTCHCTGLIAFNQMKPVMKNQLEGISTGSSIELAN